MSEPEKKYDLIAEESAGGIRLDRFVCDRLPGRSRSYIKKLIEQGQVLVNGAVKKPSYEIRTGDRITVVVPAPVSLAIEPESIPLEILYEDESFVVINKPSGVVVHPGAGNPKHTLVNALMHHCRGKLSGIGGVLRPGIVHRLDKNTSGCIVAAKNDTAHIGLSRQFSSRQVYKEYLALVRGRMKTPEGTVSAAIGRHPVKRKRMSANVAGGKESETRYKVAEQFSSAVLVSLYPGTGRTHQIRVHMAHIGHPVLGDAEYGSGNRKVGDIEVKRQMLHARCIGFTHPVTGEKVRFEAPIPEDMLDLIKYLRKG